MKESDKLLVYVVPPVEALVGIQIPISDCREIMQYMKKSEYIAPSSVCKLLARLEEVVGSHAGL